MTEFPGATSPRRVSVRVSYEIKKDPREDIGGTLGLYVPDSTV